MTLAEKAIFIWNKAYTDALGAGHPDPDAYAKAKAAPYKAKLAAAERAQSGANRLRRGSRAGRAQAAAGTF